MEGRGKEWALHTVTGSAQPSWLSLKGHSDETVRRSRLGHLATDHIVIMDKMLCSLASEHSEKDGQELLWVT